MPSGGIFPIDFTQVTDVKYMKLIWGGYYGLICASDFGGSVPGKTVQTVPFFTV